MQWIFPTEILLAIYNALVLPHINYCILSWGADSNTIFILQKKAVRAIASAGYNAHTEPFFKVIEKCTHFYFGTEKLPPKF